MSTKLRSCVLLALASCALATVHAWSQAQEDSVSREVSFSAGISGSQDVVSREVSFGAGNTGLRDVVSREVSFGAGNPGWRDAISREFSFSTPGPDLVFDVAGVSLPSEGTIDQLFEVRWRVRNGGQLLAQGPWTDRIQFSTAIRTVGETYVTQVESPGPTALGPGQAYDRVLQFLMPTSATTFTITLQTDIDAVVEETAETNNLFGPQDVTVSDLPRPNLHARFPVPLPTVDFMPGQPLTFAFRVWNDGAAQTSVPQWSDTAYLVHDDGTGGPPAGTGGAVTSKSFQNLGPLQNDPGGDNGTPGTFYQRTTATLVIPETGAGTYYLALRTDSGNAQPEGPGGDDDNLAFSTAISIVDAPRPDFSVSNITLAEATPGTTLFNGSFLTVRWIVTNSSDVHYPGGSFTSRIFLSEDENTVDPGTLLADHQLAVFTESMPGGLAPGAMVQHERLIYLPEEILVILPSMDGDHAFKVWIDSDQEVPEDEDEGVEPYWNNLAASASHPINMTPSPNLMVGSVAPLPGPGAPQAGHPMQVSWEVANGGGDGWNTPITWYDQVWLSKGDDLLEKDGPNADELLGTFTESTELDANEEWVVTEYARTTTVYLAEDTPADTYYLIVVADAGNTQVPWHDLFECSDPDCTGGESDNEGTSAAFQIERNPADLSIEALVGPSLPPSEGAPGNAIQLPWTVTNVASTGTTSVSSWTDRVYLSPSPTSLSGAHLLLSRTHSGALAPGQSYPETRTANVPAVNPTLDWWLHFVTDSAGAVFEDETTNNWTATPFDVTGTTVADLEVSSVSASARMQPGDPIMVSFTVHNTGLAPTVASSWVDSIRLSDKHDPEQASELYELDSVARTAALAAGSSYTVSDAYALPVGLTPGFWFVVVDTDVEHDVLEGDEDNNWRATRTYFSVDPPPPPGEAEEPSWLPTNLAARNVQILNSPVTAGQAVQLSWEVANDGPYATNSESWSDSVYLSLDAALDGSDTFLGYHQHTSFLDAGEVRSVLETLVVPAWVSGSWVVIVETNSNQGALQEQEDELDDAWASAELLDVHAPPLTDLSITGVAPPATVLLGEPLIFEWTTSNDVGGSDVPPGWSWQDQFWLVPEGADFPSLEARYLWQVQTNAAGIGTGEMHTQSSDDLGLAPAVPGLFPGTYRLVAISDVLGQIAELDEGNNVYDLPGTILTLETIELVSGGSAMTTLPTGASRWFRLTAPPDQTIDIVLEHPDPEARCELLLRETYVPNLGIYDLASEGPGAPIPNEQTVRIPRTSGADYYLMARCVDGAELDATLTAHQREFAVTGVMPPTVGAGNVTIAIDGDELWRATRVLLRTPAAGDLEHEELERLDDGSLLARFDLHFVEPGPRAVVVVDDDAGEPVEVLWSGQLDVVAPVEPILRVEFDAAPSIRRGEAGHATLRLTNQGNVDLEYALAAIGLTRQDGAQDPLERVVVASSELGLAEIESDGLVDSLAIYVEDLRPGGGHEVELELSVGAVFGIEEELEGVALAVACVPATMLDFLDGFFAAQSEALRAALAADPATPSELSDEVQDPVLWQSLVMQALAGGYIPLDSTTMHLPGSPAFSGRELAMAIADGVAIALPLNPGHVMPPGAIDVASAAAACALFNGTSFDCEALFPAACAGETSQTSVSTQRGGNVPAGRLCVSTPAPDDPNEKLKPVGAGPQNMVKGDEPLQYEVHFENQESATAWASRVDIRDELQPEFNSASLRFLELRIGDNVFAFPPNTSSYLGQVPISVGEGTPLFCQISAGVNALNDTAFVVLQALDFETGMPTQGGDIGLLPPNAEGVQREATGYISFRVRADQDLEPGALPPSLSGRRPRNTTTIQFNANAPIRTNTTENLLDGRPPVSTLALDSVEGTSISLSWQADDTETLPSSDFPGSGVFGYSIYVAESAEGPWESILTDTLVTSALFEGETGRTYHFKVEAKDRVGNEESKGPLEVITVQIPADCNGNGVPDPDDIAEGTSMDCNVNEVPDECDLAEGTSADCNANEQPDECDIAAGLELDCNLNGVPDTCDIASGTDPDCNGNGLPDSCEIVLDHASDVNGNGVLDGCECSWTTYCDASPNSTGVPARIGASGVPSLSFGSLRLEADGVPPFELCFFQYGTEAAAMPFGNGTLCVGGAVTRLYPVMINGSGSTVHRLLDLTSAPFDSGPGALEAGDTAYFQLWYRDPASAGPTDVYLSDGLAVTVCE